MEPQTQDRIITLRPGRPTKYTKETPRRVMKYIKMCQEKKDFITIEQLASQLGVGTRTLYAWEKEHSEFQHTLDMLRDAQRDQLIRGGIQNKLHPGVSIFLLKASHGMQDRQPLVHATQNNNFNVSPELMAEAIKLTKEKYPDFMGTPDVAGEEEEN